MTRLKSFLSGRWGFVLALAALVMVGGSYYLRHQVLGQGLKVLDRKGDMVLVVSPEDYPSLNRRIVEIAWANTQRLPRLNDIRFIIYVDKDSILDQFGQPPKMDVYLGNVFLPPGRVAALRQTPTLEEALSRWPVVYLDWEWTYQRKITYLAADQISGPSIPRGRDWAVSLNWVLFNMLPQKQTDFRWTQGFGPGWANDHYLQKADPALAALDQAPIGVSPANPSGEMIYRFDFEKSWVIAQFRDIHTTWEPTESVGLEASVDGKSWKPVYLDRGGHRRNLFATRLTPESAGGRPGARSLFLRYTLELKTPSNRSGDDLRGANLSFADLAVSFVD